MFCIILYYYVLYYIIMFYVDFILYYIVLLCIILYYYVLYYGVLQKGVGREKGRVALSTVKVVEEADLVALDELKKHGFQVELSAPRHKSSVADTLISVWLTL